MSPRNERVLKGLGWTLLLGVLAYLAVELRAQVNDHERRVTVVERDISYIKEGITEIKAAVKR